MILKRFPLSDEERQFFSSVSAEFNYESLTTANSTKLINTYRVVFPESERSDNAIRSLYYIAARNAGKALRGPNKTKDVRKVLDLKSQDVFENLLIDILDYVRGVEKENSILKEQHNVLAQRF